jgi:hypothetical protein
LGEISTKCVHERRTKSLKSGIKVISERNSSVIMSCITSQLYRRCPFFELPSFFEFASCSCETAEYHTGLSRKLREEMNLAMKMRRGLGKPSMLVREYLWGHVKTEGSYGGRVQSRLLWGPFSVPVGAVLNFILI